MRSGSRALDCDLVGGIALDEEKKMNMMVVTDKGGLKPVYPRYINQTNRTTVGTLSFKSFRSDHHDAVGIITYNEGDILQVVTNFKSMDVLVDDVPYQPIDKIIKPFLTLEKREKVEAITIAKTTYIDQKIKAKKIKKEDPSFAKFDDKIQDEEISKKEKYANISIDDLFK